MTTLAALIAGTSGFPDPHAVAWPIGFAWLSVPALLGFAALGLSALVSRDAPTPAGADTRAPRETRRHLPEAA